MGEKTVQNSSDTKLSNYCCMKLPSKPEKPQRDSMMRDLLQFQKKFRCFAQVRQDAIIVELSSLEEEHIVEAKSDLKCIVALYFGGKEPQETTIESLRGNSLPTIPEARHQVATTTTSLRVGCNGAGLD